MGLGCVGIDPLWLMTIVLGFSLLWLILVTSHSDYY